MQDPTFEREHDPEVRRLLREASGPVPSSDASRRIADAAWAQAAPTPSRPSVGGGGTVFRVSRWMAPVAAALLLAVGVLAWRGADTALAVEGDPVQVFEDGDWRDTRRVRSGAVVRVPDGARAVLADADGARIEPRSGAMLRIESGEVNWMVDVLRGHVEAGGTHLVLRAGQFEARRDTGAESFRMRVSVDGDVSGSAPAAFTASARPTFEVVSGCAWVDGPGSGLRLSAAQTAAAVRHAEGLALALVERWSDHDGGGLVERLVRGGDLVGGELRGAQGVFLHLSGPNEGLHAFQVPLAQVQRAGAELALGRALRFELESLGRSRVQFEFQVESHAGQAIDESQVGTYTWEQDGQRVEVLVTGLGTVRVADSAGQAWYPSLATLRRVRPEIAERFGDFLPSGE